MNDELVEAMLKYLEALDLFGLDLDSWGFEPLELTEARRVLYQQVLKHTMQTIIKKSLGE